MAHQILLTLSDDEYAALAAAAAQKGQPVEELARETLKQRYHQDHQTSPMQTYQELLHQMQADGEIVSLPSQSTDTAQDDAALDELIQRIGPGKSLSEMVIEDRGPR